MSLPSANLDLTAFPSPWDGKDPKELDGSGI
jgi:hypothetical protein